MKEVTLICVGKLKEKSLLEFESNYLKRISSFKFNIVELKSLQENKDAEATLILKKIADLSPEKKQKIILMTERGKLKNSIEFSNWFFSLVENSNKIFFVIAGAAGHGDELLEKSDFQFSLSPLTYPHQLARVLLVEQIYRAQTINNNHPYHK